MLSGTAPSIDSRFIAPKRSGSWQQPSWTGSFCPFPRREYPGLRRNCSISRRWRAKIDQRGDPGKKGIGRSLHNQPVCLIIRGVIREMVWRLLAWEEGEVDDNSSIGG